MRTQQQKQQREKNKPEKPEKQQQEQLKTTNENMIKKQTTQEPANKTTPARKHAASKNKKNIVNNISDLKTFLAKKKLERAQKISSSNNIPREAQPSPSPQVSHRARQKPRSGEISRIELSLEDGTSLPRGETNLSWDLGLADKSQMRDSEPTRDSETFD